MRYLKAHWPYYLMEAAGLGGFVLGAGLLTIFLEHPQLPVMNSWLRDYPVLRRVPLGIIMGGYITGVIVLSGKSSGAHINPAVTWTFYRLGKIRLADAVYYTLMQFAGATLAAMLIRIFLGEWFGHPLINYGATRPVPPHTSLQAFLAEAVISFILMGAVLAAGSSRKWEPYTAWLVGLLIAVYLIFETPYSGMSLNPARSFAGSAAAGEWQHLWIYFVAPLAAMLAAAELFVRRKKRGSGTAGWLEIPVYPVTENGDSHQKSSK